MNEQNRKDIVTLFNQAYMPFDQSKVGHSMSRTEEELFKLLKIEFPLVGATEMSIATNGTNSNKKEFASKMNHCGYTLKKGMPSNERLHQGAQFFELIGFKNIPEIYLNGYLAIEEDSKNPSHQTKRRKKNLNPAKPVMKDERQEEFKKFLAEFNISIALGETFRQQFNTDYDSGFRVNNPERRSDAAAMFGPHSKDWLLSGKGARESYYRWIVKHYPSVGLDTIFILFGIEGKVAEICSSRNIRNESIAYSPSVLQFMKDWGVDPVFEESNILPDRELTMEELEAFCKSGKQEDPIKVPEIDAAPAMTQKEFDKLCEELDNPVEETPKESSVKINSIDLEGDLEDVFKTLKSLGLDKIHVQVTKL